MSKAFSVHDVSTHDDSSDGHDEIQEVRDKAKRETQNVTLWRFALVTLLVTVGLAVTLTTFRFLREEETNNFETAVRRFCTQTSHVDYFFAHVSHQPTLSHSV